MIFAEFYTKGVQTGELIPACGDRAIYVLDGRYTRTSQIQDALEWGRKHRFEAFRIYKGDSFTRSQSVTPMFRTASH